jgi:site-specific DNA recombinase
VRDLAAEGQIQVVLAYAPDRLSRKYAYQILLIEELARNGVETLFVKAPQGSSAEDQLLVQFQGMIAEYERAQILERSRRGKRHRAQSGEVSVMSGAPYGYRYIRKTDEAPAAYALLEAEARVVQRIYEMYTVEGLSIGEITRRINAEGIPTRKASARWERSTIWAVLRNSAYRGVACFGKTRASSRTRVIRPQRRRGVITPSMTAGHERPREEWIEIAVPALVSEDSFARAQESFRRTRYDHAAAPSSQVLCRGWSVVRSAATPSRVHRHARPHVRSTITNALVRIAGENWVDRFAITAASFGRTCSIRSSGTR